MHLRDCDRNSNYSSLLSRFAIKNFVINNPAIFHLIHRGVSSAMKILAQVFRLQYLFLIMKFIGANNILIMHTYMSTDCWSRMTRYLIGDPHPTRLFNKVGARCMRFEDYYEFDCRLEHIPTNIDISSLAYLKLITMTMTKGDGWFEFISLTSSARTRGSCRCYPLRDGFCIM